MFNCDMMLKIYPALKDVDDTNDK